MTREMVEIDTPDILATSLMFKYPPRKALRKAFENTKLNTGISFVEVVSNCNSGWKMTPVQSNKWMEENMFPFYPLGDIKVDCQLVPKKESIADDK